MRPGFAGKLATDWGAHAWKGNTQNCTTPKGSERTQGPLPSFSVSKVQFKAYEAADALGFKGNVTDCLRAAAYDFAARLIAPETLSGPGIRDYRPHVRGRTRTNRRVDGVTPSRS